MERQSQCLCSSALHSITPNFNNHNRRIPIGMRSPPGHAHCSSQMVPTQVHTTYQLTRTQSSQKCLYIFLTTDRGKHIKIDRQHLMYVLHKVSGRSKIIFPLCRSSETLELVHSPPNQHLNSLHPRHTKHYSRHSQQEFLP